MRITSRTLFRRSWLAAAMLAGACDSPPPASPSEPSDRSQSEASVAAAEVADPAPGPAAKPVAQAAPMEIALQAVRRGSETVEIEVSLDEPLPPLSSMRPALQIGDEIAQRSRAGEGGRLDRLVFTVDAEQFERMPVDAGLILRAGVRSNEDATVKPKLGDVTITEIGGQP